MGRKEEGLTVETEPLVLDGEKIVGTVGMRGKRGWVTIYVYESGLRRIYKGGLLIGEYEDMAMAYDFARQESGFGG